jgi:hypothetical protein
MSISKHFQNRTFLKIFISTFLQISHLDLAPDPGGGAQMNADPKLMCFTQCADPDPYMFLGLLDPDPLVRGTDPKPAPNPDPSIIKPK